jgi:hypothetical protein
VLLCNGVVEGDERVDILLLKLILTPSLIGMVSLVGRRWGPGASGRLIGLPLTSGPVALFLALAHGTAFGADTAKGIMLGLISVSLFCVVYGQLVLHAGWPVTLLGSLVAFSIGTAVLRLVDVPLLLGYPLVIVALAMSLRLLPRRAIRRGPPVALPPRWDIPARLALATTFVLLLTGLATALGPRLSGLLAPLPIFAGIMAVFTQRINGPVPVIGLLRGVLTGAFSFATFFLIVAGLIEPAGTALAFLAATVAALLLQGLSLQVLRPQSQKTVEIPHPKN